MFSENVRKSVQNYILGNCVLVYIKNRFTGNAARRVREMGLLEDG